MNKSLLSNCLIVMFIFLSCKEQIVEPTYYGIISGVVKDSESDSPIENALITTSPSTSSFESDLVGEFVLSNLEVGEYSISAEKDGYSKKTITILVEKNKNTSATILLSKKNSNDINTAPSKPSLSSPINNVDGQETTLLLAWNSTDDDMDTLYFDVYLFSSANSNKQIILENSTDTSVVIENLNFASTYFWQVVVTDNKSEKINGDVWSFTTMELPVNPIIFSSNKNGNFEIYSAGIDTVSQKIIQLTKTASNEFWPRFNPTRELIAFVNDKDIDKHIYTMSLEGKNIFKLTQVPIAGLHNNGIGFCWSPDGNEIFYSNYNKLYRISKDGTNLTEIAIAPQDRNFREIDISSNGNKIAVLTIGQNFYDSEIYVMKTDGSESKKVVDNLAGAIENPIFSIDGNNLIYTHDASGHMSATNRKLDSKIYILNLDSMDVQDLSTGKSAGTNDLNPRISPNGANIIFENVSNDTSTDSKIMIMSIDGTNRKSLNIEGRMPDWK